MHRGHVLRIAGWRRAAAVSPHHTTATAVPARRPSATAATARRRSERFRCRVHSSRQCDGRDGALHRCNSAAKELRDGTRNRRGTEPTTATATATATATVVGPATELGRRRGAGGCASYRGGRRWYVPAGVAGAQRRGGSGCRKVAQRGGHGCAAHSLNCSHPAVAAAVNSGAAATQRRQQHRR